MKNSEEHLEVACGRLAEYLQSRRDQLIDEWIASVCSDSGVPSETMTKPEITDHIPGIFDAIIQTIRDECSNDTVERVQDLAARHTIVRWVQDYNLKAVLREISLLRAGLIRYLCAFEDDSIGFSSSARLFTSITIHRALDDIVMDATETYFKLKANSDGDEA